MATEVPEDILLAQIGQKALIKKDGKVLLCRGDVPGPWDIPGGRIHKDEEPHEGLKREIKEELSLDVEIGRPFDVFVEQKTGNGLPRYFVVFEASLIDQKQEMVVAPDEIAEVRWVSADEIDSLEFWPGWADMFKKYFAG